MNRGGLSHSLREREIQFIQQTRRNGELATSI